MRLAEIEKSLLPKPRNMKLLRISPYDPGDLRIACKGSTVVENGALDLASHIERKTGRRPELLRDGLPGAPSHALHIGPRQLSLENLPWRTHGAMPAKEGQSYSIRSVGDSLIAVGEGDVGAFYATRTIKQALSFQIGKLLLPLMDVDDSPDLLERGFWDYFYPAPQRTWSEMWHFNSAERWFEFIDDLADHKINLMELLLVDNGLNYQSRRFPELVDHMASKEANEIFKAVCEHGADRGVKVIPVAVQHPERMGILLEKHPDLAAINPQGCQESLKPRVLCLSHPKTRQMLSGIIEEVAELFTPEGVCVWLPEHMGHCSCGGCRDRWRYLELYVEICSAGFAKAAAANPSFRGRILASFMSYSDKILRMLPARTDLVYYECDRHGFYGFDKDKHFPKHVAEAAAAGRRVIGCASFRGSFTEGYANEMHVENTRGVVEILRGNSCVGVNGSMYSRPGVCRCNLLAMADAAWNSAERSAEEFLDSYVRLEYSDHIGERKKVLLALTNGWEGWHRLGGEFLDNYAVQRLLDLNSWDYLDACHLTDDLEFKDIPLLAGLVAELDTALPLAVATGDDGLVANVETCRGTLTAKLELCRALHIYGRMQWPDPQKGPWENWREEFDRCVANAVAGLDAAMASSPRLHSRYSFISGGAPLPLTKLRDRLARLLDESNRARRGNIKWPDIVAFA